MDKQTQRSSIRFRGHSLVALVVVPEHPVSEWLEHLDKLSSRSPGFFATRPVVLDVSQIAPDKGALLALLADLYQREMRVMGLEGADPSLLGPDVPPALPGGQIRGELEVPVDRLEKGPDAPVQPGPKSLLVDMPVRSGQSISFPDGDVTVLGSVSSGAEVIAGGSIHIYGALRGRAVAGSGGDPSARIYCRKLEAELLMINGCYRTDEEVEADLRGRPVQAWLSERTLSLACLD